MSKSIHIRTRPLALALALTAGLAAAPGAGAQQIDLQILLPNAANMPRTLSAWESDPSIIQVVMRNLGSQDIPRVRFSFTISGASRGILGRSEDLSPAQPVVRMEGMLTRSFLLEEVVNLNAVDYEASLETDLVRDGLPEDDYQICATAIDEQRRPLSGFERCFSFRVMDPDPPTLIYPTGALPVSPQALRFQWMPVTTPGLEYRLVVKPVFEGQSPTDAMFSNPELLSETVTSSFYQYLPSDPNLDLYPQAVGYVWQVQSLEDARPFGRNEGRSRVESFVLDQQVATGPETGTPSPFDRSSPACGVDAVALQLPANRTASSRGAGELRGVTLTVGYFSLLVEEASGSAASLSGTGTIEVPFLEATVPVRFQGLQINDDLEVFGGQVEAGEDEVLRIPLEWMSSVASLENLRFAGDGATVDAAVRYAIPSLDLTLGFAARELRITPNGVQSGSARLGLSDDVEARLGAAALRFKGSSSSEEGSYVEWGCSGFQRAVMTIEQDLPRSWLVPVDQGGNAVAGPVRITYQSIMDPRTPGLIPTGGMPRSMFAFAPGFILEPVAVSLDLSTSRNPQGIDFPADYQGLRDDAWMGLYVPNVTLNLPPAIKSFGSAAPVQTDLRGLIIDAGGVNVSAGLNNLLSLSQGDLGGWGFSVDRFELNVVNSSLVNGQLLGKVQVPIGETALDYTATISVPDEQDPQAEDQAPPPPPGAAAGTMDLAAKALALSEEPPDTTTGLKYSFRIQPPSGGIDATLFGSARMQLDASSRISVTVAKVRGETQFKPVAELNGSLTITRDVDLAGIRFQGFKIMSEEPYVSKGTWSFASPQHYIGPGPNAPVEPSEPGAPPPPPSARGLPITIENIEAMGRLDQGNIRVGIGFDAGVNVPGAKALFSAETRIEVWGIIERGSDGRSRPRFDRVDLNRICASGGAPGAFEIGDGSCLDFYRDDRTFGNGVAGTINATFVKSLNVESTARFGTTNAGLEYFYIDGSAIFNQGVRIPVIEVVSWYGFNGGVYYHMDKGTRGFVPNGNVALGLRAGVTFGASQPGAASINGNLTLDGSFGTNYNLRQLRLEGLGCMMSPILDRCRGAPTTAQMDLTYVVSRNTVTGNFRMDINNGAVRGGGQARLFAGANKFLVHVGVGGTQNRPRIDTRSKFRVTVAEMANVRGYLAAGTAGTLPPFPSPPRGAPQPNRSGAANAVASGGGIMFGVSADLDFRADYGLISASARGAAGLDVALRDLSNRTCRGQTPGLDGWYGRGQLYAYLVATGSIRVLDVISWFQDVAKVVYYYVTEWFTDAWCETKCFFGDCNCKRSRQARKSRTQIEREYRVEQKWNTYNLATLYVGALLEAGFPNPTWFTGTLQMKYYGLGGVRVNVSVPFTQGSVCRI